MPDLFSGSLAKGVKAIAVIMAGGSGTRFWPLSRTNNPKQFLALTGSERSLIQATADRMKPLTTERGIMVVTAAHQADLVRQQLPNVAVLSEPTPRNTAACIGFAAARVLHEIGDVPMICMPADHMVWGADELLRILASAAELAAKQEVVITLGMKPTAPETGFGYIQRGEAVAGLGGSFFQVKRFVEKPDKPTAQSYLDSGEYFWNSGMFVWRPSVALKEIAAHLPNLSKGLGELAAQWKERAEPAEAFRKADALYRSFESISIDVGVMERSKNVLMMSGDTFRWNDVGSWSSWADVEAGKAGENGNFTQGDVVLVDSERCFVLGNKRPGGKLIAGVGLEDVIIVETDDAVLICKRESAQQVKAVVDALKKSGRDELI